MLKKIFGRKKQSEQKSFNFQGVPQGSFLDYVLFGGRITAYEASQFYQQSSAVSIAVDIIAGEIEGIDPVIEMQDGTLLDNHPVLELLKKPNEFEDYREFIGRLSRNYLLNHDAYVYGEGALNRPPINLFCPSNQSVTIVENTVDKYPSAYILTNGMGSGEYDRSIQGKNTIFSDGNLKQMYQIHGYSSRGSNTYADSPLESAALEAKQQINSLNHNLQIIDNGGRLSMAVIFKDRLNADELEERRKRIREQFAGSENSGKIAVFASDDLDIRELGQSNKDMDFENLNKTARNAVFMRYKVPLPLITTESQTYNNFDRAIEDLYDRAVLPYTNILFSGLTKMLKPRFQDSFDRITYNPETINALKGRMLDELEKRRKINVETTNELRELLPNRGDIEGGDVYYQSATLIPAGEDLNKEEEDLVPETLINE